MTFLKLYIILLVYCSVAEAFKSTFTNEERITAIKVFYKNSFWKKEILSRHTIIIDNELKIVDYDQLFKSISNLSSNDNNYEEIEKFNNILFQISNAMYMALKCKFSELIISTYNYFFDCVNSCNGLTTLTEDKKDNSKFGKKGQCITSVIKIVSTFKIYIVKMIIDLMQFKKISPNLNSTDHTLLKSLISINLFLYHTKAYITKYESDMVLKIKGHGINDKSDTNSEINIKIVLAQVINLVERYSCKYCYVHSAYVFNKDLDEKIKDLATKSENIYKEIHNFLKNTKENNFKPFLTSVSIKYEDDITIPKETKFKIYDPEYLLFHDIFRIKKNFPFFPTLKVKWNNTDDWEELQNVYDKVKNTDDIRIIFDYQILLIEVIKYIFYIKFINVHLKNHKGDNTEEIKLLNVFDKFIDKIVPNNYPTNVYSPIIALKNALYYDVHLVKPTNGKIFSDNTVKLLVKTPVIKSWGESDKIYKTIDKIDMSEFLENILKLEFLVHFILIFELFSYESNTLGDYYLYRGHNNEKIEYSSHGIVCNQSFEQLRYNFVTFQIWLDINLQVSNKVVLKVRKSSDISIKNTIGNIHSNILWFYKTFLNNDQLNQIFLPLIINFSKMDNDASTDNFLILRQNMILALNSLEYYEINNCVLLTFNRDILREVKGEELYSVQFSKLLVEYRNILLESISERTKTYKVNENQKAIYSTRVKELIPKASHIYGSDIINFIWDGSKKSFNDVYNNISTSFHTMVDYQQLVRFQMFEIKWIISIVFEHLFLLILKNDISENETSYQDYCNLTSIKNSVKLVENLPFPESLSEFIQIFLNPFLLALKNYGAKINQGCKDRIRQQLKIFSMSTEGYSEDYYKEKSNKYSISELFKLFHDTIQNVKSILKVINDVNLIDKLQFSTILY